MESKETLKMKCRCPFKWITDFTCVYMDQFTVLNEGSCTDIEINPGNSDAWCTSQIEKSIEIVVKEK